MGQGRFYVRLNIYIKFVHSFSLYCLLFLVGSPPTYGVRHLSIAK